MRTIQIKATPTQFKQMSEFAEKIGVKIIEPKEKTSSNKKELHPNIIDANNQFKDIKNEIIKEYNKTAKIKAKQIV